VLLRRFSLGSTSTVLRVMLFDPVMRTMNLVA